MMMSQIQIDSTSSQELANQLFFILQCTVLVGSVQKGQNMNLPYSSGLDIAIPVDEIEFTPGQSGEVRIKVLCEDKSDVEFLQGLNLEGEILTVE